MKYALFLLLAILIFTTEYTVAQKKMSYDTTYIKSNRSDFVITLVSKLNYHKILLENNIVNRISYNTNSPSHHGMSIDYKWLTLEYSTSFNKYLSDNRGKTKSHYFGFGYTGRKIWFTNYWHRNSGYNIKIKDMNKNIIDHVFRDDISTMIYHASLRYGFNNKEYSNIAALWQLEQQKKSAGSFSSGISYTKTHLENNKSIIPNNKIIIFKEISQYKKLTTKLYGLNIGYLHTFVPIKHKKIFLSVAIMPGVSLQKSKIESFNKSFTIKKEKVGFDVESIISLGYNNNNWYLSLRYNSHKFFYIINNENSFSDNYNFIRLALGLKIKTKNNRMKFLRYIGL